MDGTHNFCFPIRRLEGSRIKLIPFIIPIHAQRTHDLTSIDPQAFAHTANGPYESADHFVSGLLQPLADDEYAFTYAIIDKSKPPSAESPDGEMVGMISLYEANTEDYAVEISFVQVFAEYRGRGVGTAAARLLLEYAFNPPQIGGLGLHRVEWHASTANIASIAVAEKLGFEKIGTVKYERVLKGGKVKGKIGNGRPEPPRCDSDDLCRDLRGVSGFDHLRSFFLLDLAEQRKPTAEEEVAFQALMEVLRDEISVEVESSDDEFFDAESA